MSRIYLSPPELSGTEADALVAAVRGGWLAPVGPDLDAFEAELAAIAGRRYAVGVSSGTAALHLALLAHGVGEGDEVLVPSLTFVATANAAVYCGARPVFVDSDDRTWCIDPELVLQELDRRASGGTLPAAVITVDLYGQIAAAEGIVERCRDLGVAVIEDAAEAIGATRQGRPAGSFGDVGVFSFNGNKLITTSGGGAVLTDDVSVRDRVRFLATQAREPVLHYEHHELGFNYRLSNVLAALGRAQLSTLEQRRERRRATKQWYRTLFSHVPGITFMPDDPAGVPVNWLTAMEIDPSLAGFDRDAVIATLAAADIESRPIWKPMHLQKQFAGSAFLAKGAAAVSQRLFDRGVCLPSGAMDDVARERVVVALRPLIGHVTSS